MNNAQVTGRSPQSKHKRRFLVLAGLAVAAVGLAAQPVPWTLDGKISIPSRNSLFLAVDPSGNLYATTINNLAGPAPVYTFQISGPHSASPRVRPVDQFLAPFFRGYSGIATDSEGAVYLAVDQGEGHPSYIRKLKPDMNPDPSFGTNGTVSVQGFRFQGLAVSGTTLIAAYSWGKVAGFTLDGQLVTHSPENFGTTALPTIRDIAVIPRTGEVLGVSRNEIWKFSGGSFADMTGYRLAPLVPGNGPVSSGQAIYYSSRENAVYYTLTGTGHLGLSRLDHPSGGTAQLAQASGGQLREPADVVSSPDGRFLYVSDLKQSFIFRFRSGAANSGEEAPTTAPVPMAIPSSLK